MAVWDRLRRWRGAAPEPDAASLEARLDEARALADRARARLTEERPLVALRQDMERRGTGVIDIDGFEARLVEAFAEPLATAQAVAVAAARALGPDHRVTKQAEALQAELSAADIHDTAARMAAQAIDELLAQTRREVVARLRAVGREQARREAEAALDGHRRAADAALRDGGPDDPATLQAQYRLAWDLTHAGLTDAALRLAADVLERRTAVLGPDHPDTIRSRYEIACIQGDRNDFAAALAGLAAVVADFARVDGPAAATTLTARRVEADFVGYQGDYSKAAALAAGVLHDAQQAGADPAIVDEAEVAAALWLKVA
ncbi:MAG: tetratricopeptide repeat protein [Propionibacteriaceae bacterium]|jgi:hypothetical protein|nr:tetratricopeptide repeat protein [Propionibacteriaceae bacterium]